MDNYYITTSIAYTNGLPHIGFALELVQADVLARYKRKKGKDVFFLTGTDEHGLKIENSAKDKNINPSDYVDQISEKYKTLLTELNISNNDFIRTTDKKRHWPTAKLLWQKLEQKGDIYKKKYIGYYCIGCEAFLTEKELDENWQCQIHKKEPEEIEEENYFFALSKYQENIIKLISEDSIKVVPQSRKKEILSFLKEDLTDISVSRVKEKLSWGIPVPKDENQVMYVWVDALSNYISALGYAENNPNFEKYWPADIHFIGKDILRFHSVIWIALLLSAGLEVPKNIFVHGFITSGGEKISKSTGNVVDPIALTEKFGADTLRYYLLSEIPSSGDGDYTEKKLLERYNSDLADGLGNFLSRVIGLAEKKEISFDENRKPTGEILTKVKFAKTESEKQLENFNFKKAIDKIWDLIHFGDKHIENKKPWQKSWESEIVISDMLYLCYSLSDLVYPFLPETGENIKKQVITGKKENLFNKII